MWRAPTVKPVPNEPQQGGGTALEGNGHLDVDMRHEEGRRLGSLADCADAIGCAKLRANSNQGYQPLAKQTLVGFANLAAPVCSLASD